MRIISFAWTTPALLAGQKTMTRRAWKPEYAARFAAGDLVAAWNRSPRAGRSSGARQVATIRLTKAPYQQRTGLMNDVVDYEREGIRHLAQCGFPVPLRFDGSWADWWRAWKRTDELVWVVEFELVRVLER